MESILRMIMNRLLGHAVRRGVDHLARGGRDPSDMTKEERREYRAARQSGRRARQASSILRRLMK